ncbi:hypothetical protein RhiJN_24759 [Ceratobasidium sp. AG-Ba]|nr:hypothetical protein RhiJN_24759 [Ceratobasidium sp. AG-Ba]
MPAADLSDQQAARTIECSIRNAVDRLERPPVELQWFLALPKRVRRSAQLIETAQAESRVLLEHVRAEWTRTQRAEQERLEPLAKARTQPRNLECLRAPDSAAWHGLGRRKTRCRKFKSIGRAYNARQFTPAAHTTENSPSDVLLLHPSSCHVPKRPPTPLNLRHEVRNIPGLIYTANGPASAADYGLPTPSSPTPPRAATPPPPALPPPMFPLDPAPAEFSVNGHDIDPDFAYIIAHGRHSHAPLAGYSARIAAIDVHRVENRFPGALEYLAALFFPAGVSQYNQMVSSDGLDPLLDFVYGWFDLAQRARECGKL